MSRRLCLVAGLLAFFALPSTAESVGRETKYYQRLHEFSLGRLTFSKAHVSLVAVKQKLDVEGFEIVPVLQLDRAHISLKSISGNEELLSGDVAEGTVSDPAAIVNGKFHWANQRADAIEVSELKLRLKNVSIPAHFGGAELAIGPTTTVFVINTHNLSSSGDNSELSLTVQQSLLRNVKVEWKGLDFAADLTSSENSEFRLGMPATPEIRIVSARYRAPRVQTQVSKPVSGLLDDLTIKGGLASLANILVEFHNSVPTLVVERLVVDRPDLYVPSEKLAVAASTSLLATNLQTPAESDSDAIRSKDVPTDVGGYSVAGESDKVIEVLNLAGRLSPEVLLPTNNPDARFIRSSAAAAFYRGLAKSPADGKATNIKISGHNHVVEVVESDYFDAGIDFAQKIAKDHDLPKIICSVTIDLYSGKVAGSIVKSLIGLAYQSRGAMTIATLINVGTKLSPEYGETSAYYVAKMTNFLTDPLTGKILEKVAGKFVSPGEAICEVLVGGPTVPDNLITSLYKPQLMESLASPPGDWDKVAVRYSALTDGVVKLRLSPTDLASYKKIQADAQQRGLFVKSVIEKQMALTDSQTQVAKRTQEELRAANSKVWVYQNSNYSSNQALARGVRIQEQREKEKQEQAKKEQEEQLKSTPQPGGTPGSGGPGGTRGGNNTPSPPAPANCNGVDNCMQTKVHPEKPNE